MKIASKSDIGMKRTTNQDSFSAGELHDAAWAVVCDGMGGANGGNIASSIAVKTISDCILNAYHSDMKSNAVSAMLESSVIAANLNIYDEAAEKAELQGMGTTVVAAVFMTDHAIIAHDGDSRAYVYYNGNVRQVTRDHSVVQNMLEKGELTPAEAESDPRKHVITRALGVNEDIEVEFSEVELPKGSILILCTDGLSNFVNPEEMTSIIESIDFDSCPDFLIDTAYKAGRTDNITVVLISNNQ